MHLTCVHVLKLRATSLLPLDLRQVLIHQQHQILNQQLNQALLRLLVVLQLHQVLLDEDQHSN